MAPGLDHRKFPRTVVACDVFVKGPKSGYTLTTMTSNLSEGGICVMLSKSLAKFEPVSIKLLLDGAEAVESRGRVVWSIPARVFRRKTSVFDTGIEFVNMTAAARKKITQFLEKQPSDAAPTHS